MSEQKRNKKNKSKKEIILTLPININDLDNKSKETKKETSNNLFTLGTESSEESTMNNDKLILLNKEIEEKEKTIKLLRDELKIYKSSGKINFHGQKKIVKVSFNIVHLDNKPRCNEDYLCWWCHHNIPDEPVFLPDRYVNGIYYVTGIFCTYSCAAKYNADTIDDYRTSERYSFLKQMYNIYFNNNNEIKLAEDWRFLKKHGGYMTIEEFRAKSQLNISDCSIVYPPMYFSTPSLMEVNKNINSIKKESHLVLKRNKPLPKNKNTLLDTMGLQLVS